MLITSALFLSLAFSTPEVSSGPIDPPVTWLTQDNFRYGTYLIDRPGIYRLAEDISFNPNSLETLQSLCSDEPALLPVGFDCPADAYQSGTPLPSQWRYGNSEPFVPGGPHEPRYDPAAFGLGFFAAVAISADGVTLDLNGHTLEQSEEHALQQRFFAVVELANQPFVPGQGPADFGSELTPAREVSIVNGTIGRSAHHGIHGNANERVRIENVRFVDYEVAAVALNGVDDALLRNLHASNRNDVPVLGIFSAARFIKPYLDYLVDGGASVQLNGQSVQVLRDRLRSAINHVHHDLIVERHMLEDRPQINPLIHPVEFRLFSNPSGVVDGNAYGFVINPLGVAVNGFPVQPAAPARHVTFDNVHIDGQRGAVTEVVALAVPGDTVDRAVVDPIGAIFQTRNQDSDGAWLTIDDDGAYVGNVVADAQAIVAKAIHLGLFDDAPLSTARNSISPEILAWVEGSVPQHESETDTDEPWRFLCNGDSMFHVNKGVIGFKIDGARDVLLRSTSIRGLANVGAAGVDTCGDYSDGLSHPAATLPGYGGTHVRGYTFAGSRDVLLERGKIKMAGAEVGDSIGVDVMTDSEDIVIRDVQVRKLYGGQSLPSPLPLPNLIPDAYGLRVGAQTSGVTLAGLCARELSAPGDSAPVFDATGQADIGGLCH